MKIAGSEYARLSLLDVGMVAQAKVNPIKSMQEVMATAGIAKVIQFVARNYGARVVVPPQVQDECVELVLNQFSDFALVEIRHAYRLWAAKEFPALEMYGGEFNVAHFGRVLGAYRAYRYDIRQEIARQQHKIDGTEETLRAEMDNKRRWQLRIKNFPLVLEEARQSGKYPQVSQVPPYWWKLAEAHGMIPNMSREEKLQYALRAEDMVAAYRAQRLENAANLFIRQNLRERYESEEAVAVIWTRAKQLIMFELLLGRSLDAKNSDDGKA